MIQIPVTPDSAADATARGRALEIRKRIVNGEKFAKVAAEVSDDTGSSKAGGDLGFFPRGSMEPALEQVAFSLKLDEVSEPVTAPTAGTSCRCSSGTRSRAPRAGTASTPTARSSPKRTRATS